MELEKEHKQGRDETTKMVEKRHKKSTLHLFSLPSSLWNRYGTLLVFLLHHLCGFISILASYVELAHIQESNSGIEVGVLYMTTELTHLLSLLH